MTLSFEPNFLSFSVDDRASYRDTFAIAKAVELVERSYVNNLSENPSPLFTKPLLRRMKRDTVLRPSDTLHSDGTYTRYLEGCKKIDVVANVLTVKKNMTTAVIGVDQHSSDIENVVAVTGCGSCEVCLHRRANQKSGSITLEIEYAVKLGLPVTFWSLTMDSRRMFPNFERKLDGIYEYPTGRVDENGDAIMKFSQKYKEVPIGLRSRTTTNFYTFKKMMNAFRTGMSKRYGARVLTVLEPHKDGVWHGHAIGIGFNPGLKYGMTIDRNGYDNPVWQFSDGNRDWTHGRLECVLLQDEAQINRTARYLGKYAVKGAQLEESVKRHRREIDGITPVSMSTIGWLRKPATGVAALHHIVNESADELIEGGWECFGNRALDYDRMRLVRELVYEKTEKEVPKLASLESRIEDKIRDMEFTYG